MATKGTVRIVGLTRDGDWIVKPGSLGTVDVLLACRKSGSLIEVKQHNPPTGKQKAAAKIGLRLSGLPGGEA